MEKIYKLVEHYFDMKITSELAEETGWHIGDGSMNYYHGKGFYQLRGHIEDDKDHYVIRVKPLFEKLYKVKINLREMLSTRVFGFQIWNNNLVKIKQELGLPLGKKFSIEIPSLFLQNNLLIKSVLRGIFDTDGGIYLEKKNNKLYPRLYITTISERLANQLITSFSLLGLRATQYSQLYNKIFNRQKSYIITIRGPDMFKKFMKIISPRNPKHIKKYKLFLNSKNL